MTSLLPASRMSRLSGRVAAQDGEVDTNVEEFSSVRKFLCRSTARDPLIRFRLMVEQFFLPFQPIERVTYVIFSIRYENFLFWQILLYSFVLQGTSQEMLEEFPPAGGCVHDVN